MTGRWVLFKLRNSSTSNSWIRPYAVGRRGPVPAAKPSRYPGRTQGSAAE
jgi:hypothetical protein